MIELRAQILLLANACGVVGIVSAEPYLPMSDSEVLEHLPSRGAGDNDRVTRALQTLLIRDPHNLDVALRLAQIAVDHARREGDPRQLGRAEAALAPWWKDADPPVPVLLLRATIRQSGHQFTLARNDLETALANEPGNAQAWLTLATVQQVTGDLEGAARSCDRVASVAASLPSEICKAGVNGVSGQANEAYVALQRWLVDPAFEREPAEIRVWATTLAAELAERLDRHEEANLWYRASLDIDPGDAYTLGAYADYLLDAGRPAEVLPLIAVDTPIDALLLRRALADHRLGTASAAKTERDLAERFDALHARGDRVHLREEARYQLMLRDDPQQALSLALQNFDVQKEPADARIVLESALAAKRHEAAATVATWIESSRLEGSHLRELLAQVQR